MATNDLLIRISGDTKGFAAAMASVNGQLVQAQKTTEQTTRSFSSMGSSLSGVSAMLGGVFSAGALTSFAQSAVQARAQMDSLERGLTAVMGSSERAAMELESLKEVAKLPGLSFQDAVRGSVNLQAAGFSAETARKALLGFGNALATIGRGKEDLDGVFRALSQIAAKGKVSAEEINQLAERLPQIRQIMKGAFGTADTEVLQKMGISAKDFVETIISELEKLPKATGGLKNDLDNFADAWQQTLAEIGRAAEPAVSKGIGELSKLAGWIKENTPFLIRELDATQDALSFGTRNFAIDTVKDQLTALAKTVLFLGEAWRIAGIRVSEAVKAMSVGIGPDSGKKSGEMAGQEQWVRDFAGRITESFKYGTDVPGSIMASVQKDLAAAVDKSNVVLNAQADAAKGAAAAHKELSLAMQGPITQEEALAREIAKLQQADYDTYFRDLAKGMYEIANGAKTASIETARYNRILEMMRPRGIVFEPDVEIPQITLGDDAKAAEAALGGLQTKYGDLATAALGSSKQQSAAMREVSTVFTDMSRDIAKLIMDGGKLKDVFIGAAKSMAEAMLRLVIQGAFKKLGETIMDSIGKLTGLGKVFSAIFGGGGGGIPGASATAITGISDAAKIGGGIAGGAGSAAGGIGGAAGSSVAGIVGAVGSVVSAISGVIGNFQMAGMNKSLDLIEHETRYSQIHLLNILEKINKHLPGIDDLNLRLNEAAINGWKVWSDAGAMQGAFSGGGGISTTINFSGAWIGYRDVDTFVDDLVRRIKSRL